MKYELRYRAVLIAACLVSGLGACGGADEREITQEREIVTPVRGAGAGLGTARRFGLGGVEAPAAQPAPVFRHATPEGWKVLAPKRFREINMLVAGQEDAECFLSVLPKGGGGIAMNVDRWRGQLGLAPLSAEAKAALGEQKMPLLGGQAVLVDFVGRYRGMGGGEGKEGFRLIGLLLEDGGYLITVKMTGPAALLEQERAHFDAFCASLERVAASPAAGVPGDSMGMAGPGSGGLSWDVPAGWERAPDRAMRIANFKAGETKAVECYLSSLTGTGGGLASNINRWRRQMGQASLGGAELAALERIEVLGTQATLVEIRGRYTGMGEADAPGAMLLGMICSLPGRTLFAKMTGPEAEVALEIERFREFCRSLKAGE